MRSHLVLISLLPVLVIALCVSPPNPYTNPENAEIGEMTVEMPDSGFVVGDTARVTLSLLLPEHIEQLTVRCSMMVDTVPVGSLDRHNTTVEWALPLAAVGDSVWIVALARVGDGRVLGDSLAVTVRGRQPRIAQQSPSALAVPLGTTCTLMVAADGTTPLSYAWSHVGTAIEEEDSVVIGPVKASDMGWYVCEVSNEWGKAISDTIWLHLDTTGGPRWMRDPVHLVAVEGSPFAVDLRDSVRYYGSEPLIFGIIASTVPGDSLDSYGIYTFSAGFGDSGKYSADVVVSDGDYRDTTALAVSVGNVNHAPQFSDSMPGLAYQIGEGDSLCIPFSVTDSDGDKVTVFLAASDLPHQQDIVLVDTALRWKAGMNDKGAYYATLGATDGTDTTSRRIDIGVGSVNLPPRIGVPGVTRGGVIESQEGDTVKLSVVVSDPDTADKPSLLAAEALPFSDKANGVGEFDTASGAFWFVPSYGLSTRTAQDTLKGLTFFATDNGTPALKDSFSLDILVKNTNRAPRIALTSPANGASGVELPMTLCWQGSDADVADAADLKYSVYMAVKGETSARIAEAISDSSLEVAELEYGSTYTWYVVAYDGVDSAVSQTDTFTVARRIAPTIKEQPKHQTVLYPNGVSFSVMAEGSPPLDYQWFEEGKPIAGADSTVLSLPSTSEMTHGTGFRRRVCNRYGDSVVSTKATLSFSYEAVINGGTHGTATPSRDTVPYGEDLEIRFQSLPGYVLSSISVNGTGLPPNTDFIVLCVTEPLSIVASHSQHCNMVPLPEGSFDRVQVEIMTGDTVARGIIGVSPFFMASTETTQKQYYDIMHSEPSWNTRQPLGNYPVEQVSWVDAILYCNALTKAAGLDTVYTYTEVIYDQTVSPPSPKSISGLQVDNTAHGYRLPTEAEWEYACKGTSVELAKYWWGNSSDANIAGERGWYDYNSGDSTHHVGRRLPNGFGLHDMLGNVSEWVGDYYSNYFSDGDLSDPFVWTYSTWNPTRGGRYDAPLPEISRRGQMGGDQRRENLGFRVALPQR